MDEKKIWRKKFWNSSLTKKVNFTLCVLVIVPIIILGSIMISSILKSNMEEVYKENQRNMEAAAQELENCYTDIDNFWRDCMGNDSLIRIGQDRVLDRDYVEVRKWMDEFYKEHPYLFNVCVTLQNGKQFQAGAFLAEDMKYVYERIGNAKGMKWYVGESYERIMPVNAGVYDRLQVFYAPIDIIKKNTIQKLGTISFKIEEEKICNMYTQFFDEKRSVIFMVDVNGKVISSTDKKSLYDVFMEKDTLEEKYQENSTGYYWEKNKMYSYYYSPVLKQFLIVQIPFSIFWENVSGIFILAICVIIMCLVFSIFFGRMQKKYIVNPVFEMVDAFKKLENEEFLPVTWNDREDEIGILQKRYNKMVVRLDTLINQVYRANAEKSEAQLRALTEQINPHFLYNTLDSIHWKAIRNRDSEVAEQILALSDVYRYLLNKGQEFISIKDEADFHERYLYLMRMRFGNRLAYESFIESNAEKIEIPKLIIQPLLENAIVHGIEPIEEGGRITLQIGLDKNVLKILIEDTGVGFGKDIDLHEDEIETLQGAFALKNINKRLKLYYKERYSYHVQSSEAGGSRVEILIGMEG